MTNDSSLELQIITDDLTGLYNRRFLNKKLIEETERSQEQKECFGLIMLDLDHFKEVNDQYGHAEGDQALIWISTILRKSVRSEDLVIRFAGDEFFLILPGAGLKEAQTVAKRIYSNISENPFRGSRQQVEVSVGVSGGIAIFPNDATSVEKLMESADSGLYMAKEQGRGKICLASDAKKLKSRVIDRNSLLHPPFVGHDKELKDLRNVWIEVKKNKNSAAFLVRGESGTGKTRFISEFLSDGGTKDHFLLSASCHSHEFEIPYQPLIDLLSQWIEKNPDNFYHNFSSLSLKEKAELKRLVPQIQSVEESVNEGDTGVDPANANSWLYYGMAALFKSAAKDSPVVLVIEDLQWGDAASLDLFAHIISQLAKHSLFIVFSIQPALSERIKNEISKFFRRISRDTRFQELDLPLFKKDAIRKLIDKIFHPENPGELREVEEILFKESEGNPLFVKELLLKLIDEKILNLTETGWKIDSGKKWSMPDRMRDVAAGKIEILEDELKLVLEQAAVIGKEFVFDDLKEVSEKNEGHLIDLLDEALTKGVLEEVPGSKYEEVYRFSSFTIQRVLYEELSSLKKRRLHRKILELLERKFRNNLKDHIETLFYHAKLSNEMEKSFLYGLESGEKAHKNYGLREAKDYFSQAFEIYEDLPDESKKSFENTWQKSAFNYGETLIDLGIFDEARKVLSSLNETAEQLDLLGFIHFKKGEYSIAKEMYEKGEQQTTDLIFKSKIQSRFSDLFLITADYEKASISAQNALNLAIEGKNPAMEALALKSQGSVFFVQGDFPNALDCYRKSIKKYRERDNRSGVASCMNNVGLIHYKRKKYAAAKRCFLRAKNLCDEIGYYSLNLRVLNNLGSVYLDCEQTPEATEYYSRCLTLAEDTGEVTVMIACYLNLGNIFISTDPDQSEEFFSKGLSLCKNVGETSKEAYFYSLLGDVSIQKKEENKAEEWYKQAVRLRTMLKETENELYSRIKLLELYESFSSLEKFKALFEETEKFISATERSGPRWLYLKKEFDLMKERAFKIN